ncbi:MAG: hypothetical protein KY467_16930 [Gemmatimonadetes bacterium]|nr:hypothetical protein [Gemmatimonadota bacterium]
MSSTEDRNDEALRRFHAERLAPAAERLKARGAELFPLRPNPSAASYWTERAPAEYVFELDAEEVSGYLRARWEAEGLPELAPLAAELGTLSRQLEQKPDTAPAELSPFIYAMF